MLGIHRLKSFRNFTEPFTFINFYHQNFKHLLSQSPPKYVFRSIFRTLSFNYRSSTHSNPTQKRRVTSLTEKILLKSPKNVQPYLHLIRFDKQIGSWLLFLPCTFGVGLGMGATHNLPDAQTLALFACGAVLMRGAGCIINDIWDSDLDSKVSRTRERPLASGRISLKSAIPLLFAKLALSLAILLQFNTPCVILGVISPILVINYPLFKRLFNWPQFILGTAMNYGCLMGFCAMTNSFSQLHCAIPLYFACICWTIVYDTIYAFQDIDDDVKVGVKSTAILFSDRPKLWLNLFCGGMAGWLAISGLLNDASFIYYTAINATMLHLVYSIYRLNIKDHFQCLDLFKSGKFYGIAIASSIFLDNYLKIIV